MDDGITKLTTALKQHGQSMTEPRRIVFEALQRDGPLTMADLITASGAGIDRASIYRTVSLFERIGVVQRLQIGWKYRIELSDDFQHHHHHLHCLRCGQLWALPEDASLESRLGELAAAQGFAPVDHQIEIRGYCDSCRAASVPTGR